MSLALKAASYNAETGLHVELIPGDRNHLIVVQADNFGRLLGGESVTMDAQPEYKSVNSVMLDDTEELQAILGRIAGLGSDLDHPERYTPDADRNARVILPDVREGLVIQFFELVEINPPIDVPV